jgi:hypothetical protein
LIIGTILFSEEIIYIPYDVKEIKSATYSTGNSEVLYIKIFCLMENGKYILFMASKVTPFSLFGISDFTIPEKIIFKKKEELQNKIIWK